MRFVFYAVMAILFSVPAANASTITPAFGKWSSASMSVDAGKQGVNTMQVVGATFSKPSGKPTMTIDTNSKLVLPSGGDDAVPINAALATYRRVILAASSYHITTPIVLTSGRTLSGTALLDSGTIIYSSVSGDYSIKAVGTLGIAGPLVANVTLKDFKLLREGSNTTSGVNLTAVTNSKMTGVKIDGMSGTSLLLKQVWDSYLEDGYVINSASTGPTTVLHYGSTDDTNNIRFKNYTWEANLSTAIDFQAGFNASYIYGIHINDSKIEHGSGNLDPLVTVTSGANVNVDWMGTSFSTPNDGRLMFDMVSTGTFPPYIEDWTFGNAYISSGSLTPHSGMMRFYNAKSVNYKATRFITPGGFATAPVLVGSGCDYLSADGGSVAGSGAANVFSAPTNNSHVVNGSLRINGVTGERVTIQPSDGSGNTQISRPEGNAITLTPAGGGNGVLVGVNKTPDGGARFDVGGSLRGTTLTALHTPSPQSQEVIWLNSTRNGAPVNQKVWGWSTTDSALLLRSYTDNFSSSAAAMTVNRSGMALTSIALGAPVSVTGAISATSHVGAVTALTPGTTVTLDASTGSVFTLNPAQSETINVVNATAGQTFDLRVLSTGTTPYTLTFGTNMRSTGTFSTGAVDSKYFLVSFVCISPTNCMERSRTAAQ